MKLYEQTRAPNPRRVRMFAAEKGIEIASVQVDIMKGDQRLAEFSRINPYQQIPVLVLDDGTAISETMAICRYLEALNTEPALFGRAPIEQAMIEMWARHVELGLLARVANVIRHTHPAFAVLESPQFKDWGEANRAHVVGHLIKLDGVLATRPWIAGDSFSVADITALVAIDFMKLARIQRPAELVNLERWYGLVSARPSAKAGM